MDAIFLCYRQEVMYGRCSMEKEGVIENGARRDGAQLGRKIFVEAC